MKRRKFLFAAGAIATIPLLPHVASKIWIRVATAYPPTGGLGDPQLALISALADTIIPRTETPSATDVGVPAWVNFMVTEYLTDAERAEFLGGIYSIDRLAMDRQGVPFAMTSADQRKQLMGTLEHRTLYERFVMHLDRPSKLTWLMSHLTGYSVFKQMMAELAPRARAYVQLKELVITGYFTSEQVQKDVLKVSIIPGYFDGAAPMPAPRRMSGI